MLNIIETIDLRIKQFLIIRGVNVKNLAERVGERVGLEYHSGQQV